MHLLKVSVIMPSYNSAAYVREAISSVLDQTYKNWELIIVDDASTDNSIDVIRPYVENDPRIRLHVSEKNAGAAATRNKCTELATGDVIAFLDSDDLWLKEKLEKQVAVYQSDPSATFVFTHYQCMDKDGNPFGKEIKTLPVLDYNELLKACSIGCLTVSYNVNILGKRFFVDYGHEDYILWLQILKEGHQAIGVPESLAWYRITKGSLSANKLKAAGWQWNIYRKFEKLNVLQSMYYFVLYAFAAIRKHYL